MTNQLRLVCGAVLVSCWWSAGCGRPEGAREVHVAAAANVREALGEISRAFEARSGVRVVPTTGATAQLTQQIENGAPIDVFLSADTQHVDRLIQEGAADAGSRAVYARGVLVLWAPSRPEIGGIRDLAGSGVTRVGCARPELAPYGAAAVESLKKAGVWAAVEPKMVYGQSISASKEFADSGNVAAAFTALALVKNLKGHYAVVGEDLHAPIDQALCVVKGSVVGGRFREFVMSAEGQGILARFGYATGR